jgi:hypothetical protein
MLRYREDDRFETQEKYLKMSLEELKRERQRLYTELVKSGKIRVKRGDRILVNKDNCPYEHRWGTVINISNSGWSDCGGIFRLQMDDGIYFNCSLEAVEEVVEGGK